MFVSARLDNEIVLDTFINPHLGRDLGWFLNELVDF